MSPLCFDGVWRRRSTCCCRDDSVPWHCPRLVFWVRMKFELAPRAFPIFRRAALDGPTERRGFLMIALLTTSLQRPLDFASPFSWDDAYSQESHESDWLVDANDLRAPLLKALGHPSSARWPLLELGSGTSPLAAQLHIAGFSHVTATDASRTCVQTMERRYPQLHWKVADARNTKLPSASFGSIVDKGTLDALATGDGWDYEVRSIATEVHRLLRPGGRWACVSLMPPSVWRPTVAAAAAFERIESEVLVDGVHLHVAEREATA